MFQGRIKGETELALAEMRKQNLSFQACSIRPFAVDIKEHDAICKYIGPRPFIHKVSGVVFGGLIRSYMKDYWAPTVQLGEFLTELAMGQHGDIAGKAGLENEMVGEFVIWSNVAMRKLKEY